MLFTQFRRKLFFLSTREMQCFVSSSTLLSVLDGAHILLRNPNSPLGYGVLSYAQGFYLTVSSRVNWVLSFISATLSRVERYPSYPAFEDWALPVISSVRGLIATRQITRSTVENNPSNHAFIGWAQPVISRRNCVKGHLKILIHIFILERENIDMTGALSLTCWFQIRRLYH